MATEESLLDWKNITIEELIRLSYIEHLSASRIGAMYGVSGKVVASKKSKFGLNRFTVQEIAEKLEDTKLRDELYYEWIFKNWSEEETAHKIYVNAFNKTQLLEDRIEAGELTEKGIDRIRAGIENELQTRIDLLNEKHWYELYRSITGDKNE